MDYSLLEFTHRLDNVAVFKNKLFPALDLYIDTDENEILNVEIDEEYNDEVDYRDLNWWSDWNGDEVGYDEVLIVGLYAIKDFPNIEVYIDVENERILEAWLVEE